MVQVPAHVVQVVVLSAGTDALLAVDHAAVGGQLAAGVCRAQQDGLELRGQRRQSVNTSICGNGREDYLLVIANGNYLKNVLSKASDTRTTMLSRP